MVHTHYDNLKVACNAPVEVIRAAYRALAAHRVDKNKTDKWNALVRFDDEIRSYTEELRTFGDAWVAELREAYFTLNEDRKCLPNIVRKLTEEAKQAIETERIEAAQRKKKLFERTADGAFCTEKSLEILLEAEKKGYILAIEDSIFTLTGKLGKFYLHSNYDKGLCRKFRSDQHFVGNGFGYKADGE